MIPAHLDHHPHGRLGVFVQPKWPFLKKTTIPAFFRQALRSPDFRKGRSAAWFWSLGKDDPLCRTIVVKNSMQSCKETMPDDLNSVDLSKRLLPGFIPYWSRRFSLPRFITKSRTHSARFHLIRGRILVSLGRYDQAIDDFRSALRLDWRYEQAALWLAKVNAPCRTDRFLHKCMRCVLSDFRNRRSAALRTQECLNRRAA
jgi:tetratricopeptide (TPR) repeat protein